ncbi:ABC transporter ATP-binding protein [Myxococcota bacterium]|nr:ABC transporter ATP-binding protein [Myxococcota bacterium]
MKTQGTAEDTIRVKEGSDWRIAIRLFSYIWQHKTLFFASLALYPLSALSIALPPYLIALMLDKAIPAGDKTQIMILGGIYLGALVVEYLSAFISQITMSVLGLRSMLTLREDLFRHVQKLPASYFDRQPVGRILTRITNDPESLTEIFASGAITIIGDLMTLIAVVGMMFYLNVRLTLLAFLVIPPLLILITIFRHFARRAFREIRRHLARINAFLAEHLSAMDTVQSFQQEARTAKEFYEINDDFRRENRKTIIIDAYIYAVVEAIGTAAVALMIGFGANEIAIGAITAGTLVAFIQYIRRFFGPIRDLAMKYTMLQSAFAAAERCFTLLEEETPVVSPENPIDPNRFNHSIELKDVSFAYRDLENGEPDWVLKNIDLKIEKGEKIALVGPTGSGKSTLIKLLNRSYDPLKGEVLLDDKDLRKFDLAKLRGLFAVVLQDVFLFSLSILDNLRLGEDLSKTKVLDAARAVEADDFISKLKEGYESRIQENGRNLSAGERQLLAFARALALDPQILLLDEATSNIDSETEARIQKALDVVLEGRTAVIVAHRLTTVRKVDRILVLQDGQIIQEGSHDELMKEDGLYRRLALLHSGISL